MKIPSEALKAGQSIWNDNHMAELIKQCRDLQTDEERLLYWTGYCSAFLGAMAADIGLPATKVMVKTMGSILDDVQGIINPDG